MPDFLKDLFINEAKPALDRHTGTGSTGGSSGGNGIIPTKLSEFENDLFYIKKELFLELTKDDFKQYTIGDYDVYWWYIDAPKLDWLKSVDNIAWELSYVYGDEYVSKNSDMCESYLYDYGDYFWYEPESSEFSIASGIDAYDWDENNLRNDFTIQLNITDEEWYRDVTIKLYKVDAKKIPIEYCDTSELEKQLVDIIEGNAYE